MKFKYLGTAACEGLPALFCSCDVCRRIRENGGPKDHRLRSQALIDDALLIEFNPDTFANAVRYGLDLIKISSCLVTHSHSDHFYAGDLEMRSRGLAFYAADDPPSLHVYGGAAVGRAIHSTLGNDVGTERSNYILFHEVEHFKTFETSGYAVTALPASHGPESTPVFYSIEKDGKAVLYANDTGPFFDNVWEWITERAAGGKRYDMVSLDCTGAASHIDYPDHNDVWRDIEVKKRMIEIGAADENTVFILHHFSHDGEKVLYDELMPIAKENGFLISYDGMELEL